MRLDHIEHQCVTFLKHFPSLSCFYTTACFYTAILGNTFCITLN